MSNPRKSKTRKTFLGTSRNDRNVRAAGERLAKCPPPPKTLSANAAAEWKRLAPIVHGTGILTAGDLRALELLASTLATEAAAAEVIAKDGLVSRTADGGLKSHPAARILETARSQAAQLLREFGLTPKSRSYVEPAPAVGGTRMPWEI